MARLHRVEQLEAGISSRLNGTLVDRDVEVLVEGRKPGPDGDAAWYGRSRGNKLVHFRGRAEIGDLVTVRVERAGPWSVVGTAVGEKAAARA